MGCKKEFFCFGTCFEFDKLLVVCTGHVSASREGLVKMCLLVKVSQIVREIMVFWFEFEWKTIPSQVDHPKL